FTSFAKLGMQHSIQRFHRETLEKKSAEEIVTYYSSIIFGAAIAGALTTVLFVIGLYLTPASWLNHILRDLLLLASVLIFVRTIRAMISNLLQVEGRTRAFNVSEVSIKVFSIALICLLLFQWE